MKDRKGVLIEEHHCKSGGCRYEYHIAPFRGVTPIMRCPMCGSDLEVAVTRRAGQAPEREDVA